MQPRYFKDQMYIEFEASVGYLKNAIDYIVSNPKWSMIFKQMSEARLRDANNLYKMFIEFYVESENKDAYLSSLRDAIMDVYSKENKKIDDLLAIYKMIADNQEGVSYGRSETL